MDMELFKQMFSKYCHNEIEAGHCDSFYGCGNCPINAAYNEIFGTWNDDEQDCEEDM